MTDKDLLKYHIAKSGKTVSCVIKYLGISEASYYRKVNGVSDFTRNEIQLMKDILNLSMEEVEKIFFAKKLT
ncbi:MAG: hypothetical protein E6970_05995 [Peptostreptococcus sp.]|uniref:hypothetical protein n=1 Tax=Peptostreptococcus TaxID=1257 RepID=UPI0028FFAD99|nr:hypothetical protein [Peptostreptococcus sp.]MDU1265362.1 hypothetical protein [Peptostreptococcus sp.]